MKHDKIVPALPDIYDEQVPTFKINIRVPTPRSQLMEIRYNFLRSLLTDIAIGLRTRPTISVADLARGALPPLPVAKYPNSDSYMNVYEDACLIVRSMVFEVMGGAVDTWLEDKERKRDLWLDLSERELLIKMESSLLLQTIVEDTVIDLSDEILDRCLHVMNVAGEA